MHFYERRSESEPNSSDLTRPNLQKARSSRPEVFCKKAVLRNFAKFTGKDLCQRLFFNKVSGLRLQLYLKRDLAQVFSCEFCEIFKKTFFIEHLQWLLLKQLRVSSSTSSCLRLQDSQNCVQICVYTNDLAQPVIL